MPCHVEIAELDATGVGFFKQGDGLGFAAAARKVRDRQRHIEEAVHATGGRIGLIGEPIRATQRVMQTSRGLRRDTVHDARGEEAHDRLG